MRLTYDEQKRQVTLAERGLDFARASEVFAARTFTVEDDRWDYGEVRYQTVGRLGRKIVMLVWTPRGDARHVISMRKCNAQEREAYIARLG